METTSRRHFLKRSVAGSLAIPGLYVVSPATAAFLQACSETTEPKKPMTTIDLNEAIERLKADLPGKVLLAEDADFEKATTGYNAAVAKRPRIAVLAENTQDVAKTIRFARQHDLPLSVRGGGHDWAGRAIVANGVQINLRRLNKVEINAAQKTAVVQGGATSMDVIRAAEAHNLLAVTGTVGDVGYTGLTLGGGYGLLSPSLGMAIDNLISAELVLADGTVVTANEQENPELFWAIRGGGGNFGVVTSMRIRLHDAKPILAGTLLFKGSDAQQVLQGYNQLMASAPNELSVNAGMVTGPDGKPVVLVLPIWYGDPKEGERYVANIRSFATPIREQVGTMSYRALVEMLSATNVPGLHYAVENRWLLSLEREQIQSVMDAMQQITSPRSTVLIQQLHGAATAVKASATPFPVRKSHFLVVITAAWEAKDAANRQLHEQWANTLSEALKKGAYPGGYANLLGPDEAEQVSHAYGDNLSRLQRAKRTYDPDGVFNAIPIPGQ